MIDQFLASARAKWQQEPSLVLLLPHGYEGQGPEHSSGRLERFLQLVARDNLRVANCTTAAQYFHLLRRQAALLKIDRRPLIIMTPKSLLRHPLAASPIGDFTSGTFRPVLDDATAADRRASVTRLVLCSGRIWVDLEASEHPRRRRQGRGRPGRAARPVPAHRDLGRDRAVPEPDRDRLGTGGAAQHGGVDVHGVPPARTRRRGGSRVRYVGRPNRASPAEGSADMHAAEQSRIVATTLTVPATPTNGRSGNGNGAATGNGRHASRRVEERTPASVGDE